jgi:hypothetical protein
VAAHTRLQQQQQLTMAGVTWVEASLHLTSAAAAAAAAAAMMEGYHAGC